MSAELADEDLPTHPYLAWKWHFEYGGSILGTSDSPVVQQPSCNNILDIQQIVLSDKWDFSSTPDQLYDNLHIQQSSCTTTCMYDNPVVRQLACTTTQLYENSHVW